MLWVCRLALPRRLLCANERAKEAVRGMARWSGLLNPAYQLVMICALPGGGSG